jgi:hypothetical protein
VNTKTEEGIGDTPLLASIDVRCCAEGTQPCMYFGD